MIEVSKENRKQNIPTNQTITVGNLMVAGFCCGSANKQLLDYSIEHRLGFFYSVQTWKANI